MVKTGGKYLQGFDLHLILQTEFNQFSSDNSKPFDNQHKNKWGSINLILPHLKIMELKLVLHQFYCN